MLQSIRDRLQGWLAGGIIAIICVIFALWGIRNYQGGGATSNVVAKVGNFSIHSSELNLSYQRLRQQEQMQLGASFIVDTQTELRIKEHALKQLILTHILSQSATSQGYRVIPGEVTEAILSIPAFQVDGRFSRDRFNEVLDNIMYTEEAFLNDLQTTMLIKQVSSGYIDSEFALPSETETAIKLVNQKRDFGYMIVPATQFTQDVKVSNQQAQDYYNQHQAEFTTPEQVSIQYILLSLSQMSAGLHFSADQLNQYYQDNISTYTTPQRWHIAQIFIATPQSATPDVIASIKAKADSIYQQLTSGGNFAELAADDSDDATSAHNGGLTNWFSSGMVDPSLEAAVSALKVGDIAGPIQVKNGFIIAKLVGVQASQVMPFEKVKSQVQKALAQQQAEQAFADASEKLSNLTYSNPSSLDVAAKALGLQVNSTGLFSNQGGKDTITANPKVIDSAFSSDVLQGNNSDVINLDPNTVVVLRIKQHIAEAVQPYETVKDEVVQKLRQQLAQQKAQSYGQGLVQAIQQGKDPNTIAAGANLKWVTLSKVGRFDMRAPAGLLFDLFKMPRPNKNIPFSTNGFTMPNGDYAVLMLTAASDGTFPPNQHAVQERIYREELENSYGQLDYDLYVEGLINKTKVHINKDVLTSPTDQQP